MICSFQIHNNQSATDSEMPQWNFSLSLQEKNNKWRFSYLHNVHLPRCIPVFRRMDFARDAWLKSYR